MKLYKKEKLVNKFLTCTVRVPYGPSASANPWEPKVKHRTPVVKELTDQRFQAVSARDRNVDRQLQCSMVVPVGEGHLRYNGGRQREVTDSAWGRGGTRKTSLSKRQLSLGRVHSGRRMVRWSLLVAHQVLRSRRCRYCGTGLKPRLGTFACDRGSKTKTN